MRTTQQQSDTERTVPTHKEICVEIIKVAVLAWLLYYTFNNANYPGAFWNPTINIFRGAIIGLVYTVGHIWGKVVSKNEYSNWKAYLNVFYVVGILTLLGWATHGTYTDADGSTVVDFIPTTGQRDDAAVTIFFSLLIPALYGVSNGKNP
jgi:hypothetical protein